MPLCLKRKFGERVRLTLPDGREVWLSVERPHNFGGTVVLTVDAPPDVLIDREERIGTSAEKGGAA